MTVRILHVGKFFPPQHGGMETFLADLIAAQREQGIEAAAIVHGAPRREDPAWLIRVPVQAQVLYAPIALGFRSALARAIERFDPDSLHLHMPNNAVFWVLTLPAARRLPWIVHWHSDVVPSAIRTALRLAYAAYRPFEQEVLERSECIVATSPPYLAASEPLQRWRAKCTVVPLGLRFAAEERPSPVTADESAGAASMLRLLAIGRLAYYKGLDTLIRAVAPMSGVELAIVGDGELRRDLEARVAELTRSGAAATIRFLGSVGEGEKLRLLAACDVVCLASCERTEAFGVVVLEAMRAARPCLVSDLPGSGLPWLVGESGAGLLAPVRDVAGWQAAIARLRDDPVLRRRLGESGRRAFDERFSIDACARRLSTLYARALGERTLGATRTCRELIVIPARDEATTIGPLIRRLQAGGWHAVLVVDDQSKDETGEAARAAGAMVMRPVLPVGAWGATQAGIRMALARGYDAVVTMDADGQHEVDEIPALLRRRDDADVVIGAHPERASRLRHLAWWWFRRLSGFELRDLTSGFRCYNRPAMRLMASREATLLDYQDLGALMLISRAGLRIAEVPVSMSPRSVGKSRVFRSWFSVARYMAVTTLLCLSRWDVPSRRTTA